MSGTRLDDARDDARAYWSRAAAEKEFTHPFREGLFARFAPHTSPVLDLGCGQGRLTAELAEHGWEHVIGADTAPGMIALGRERHPELELRLLEPGPLPWADGSFGGVLLFSVLTCVPDDGEAAALVREVGRVLAPGGVVYTSDLLLQTDERNRERYRRGLERFGRHGVFELPEGVVLRHHELGYLGDLYADLALESFEELDVVTMNGHAARGFQLVARRPGAASDLERSGP